MGFRGGARVRPGLYTYLTLESSVADPGWCSDPRLITRSVTELCPPSATSARSPPSRRRARAHLTRPANTRPGWPPTVQVCS